MSILPGGVYIFRDAVLDRRKLCKVQQAKTTVSTLSGVNLIGVMKT